MTYVQDKPGGLAVNAAILNDLASRVSSAQSRRHRLEVVEREKARRNHGRPKARVAEVMGRLLSVMPAESPVDREQHARNIAEVVVKAWASS